MIRILHLVGSAVSDFYCDLSRLYAQDCLEATADVAAYVFLIAYVTPDGRWRFPVDLSAPSIAAARPMALAEAVATIDDSAIDLVVPQMFCIPGMTAYRSLFDLLDIPYLGNRPEVMALGLDKSKAKAVVASAGVATPAGERLRRGERPTIDAPAVVKPVDADNSLGVTLVRAPDDFEGALRTAFEHSHEVLVESYVDLGREVRCGILVHDGELLCLPLEEYRMDRVSKPIRGHDDKIAAMADGGFRLVAKGDDRAWIVETTDPVTASVWEAARRCHAALGCRLYSLFDFRIDPDGRPWFLEASLYCSFARQSVLSAMADAGGVPLKALFERMIRQALSGRRSAAM